MQKIFIVMLVWVTASLSVQAQDPYITTPGPYGQTFMSYQPMENIFYSGTSRFRVTSTVNQNNVSALFNGQYEETAVTVPSGQAATITIDFQGKGEAFVTNPSGYIYLNFFDEYYPDSLTATIYDSTGADDGIEAGDWSNVSTTSPYILLRAHIPSWFAGLSKIVIRVKSRSSVETRISEIEYILEHPGQYERGLVSKWANNTLWSDVIIKDTGNVQRAFIKNNGNAYLTKLGIGTTNINDTAKLFVEGQIRARQVKVDIDSWPDYVFKRNYPLPSLQTVQTFINKNNHLPGIPSAAQVQAGGIDIGQNQAALMQKIEELTLYLIEQDKKLELQQQEINKLKKSLRKRTSGN